MDLPVTTADKLSTMIETYTRGFKIVPAVLPSCWGVQVPMAAIAVNPSGVIRN